MRRGTKCRGRGMDTVNVEVGRDEVSATIQYNVQCTQRWNLTKKQIRVVK